jgi:hypothetical protein
MAPIIHLPSNPTSREIAAMRELFDETLVDTCQIAQPILEGGVPKVWDDGKYVISTILPVVSSLNERKCKISAGVSESVGSISTGRLWTIKYRFHLTARAVIPLFPLLFIVSVYKGGYWYSLDRLYTVSPPIMIRDTDLCYEMDLTSEEPLPY